MNNAEQKVSQIRKVATCTTACALLVVSAVLMAKVATHGTVIPFEDVKFIGPNPIGNTVSFGAQLLGDLNGSHTMLIKLKKGTTDSHFHSADYELVVIQGTATHWEKGIPGSDSKPLGPGSYWFEPRKVIHRNSCLTDECLFFARWIGKEDAIAAGE